MSPSRQLFDLLGTTGNASIGGLLVSLIFYYLLLQMRKTINVVQRSKYFIASCGLVILVASVFMYTLEKSVNTQDLTTTLLLWLVFLVCALAGYKIAESYFTSIRNQFESLAHADKVTGEQAESDASSSESDANDGTSSDL